MNRQSHARFALRDYAVLAMNFRADFKAEYLSWKCMKSRCLNRKSGNYQNYGARGITVCDRWLNFMNFIADMGPRPSQKHSLDRIDNGGPYCKQNCRWATAKEQVNNRRNTIYVIIDGERLPLADAIRKYSLAGLPEGIIRARLHRGWDAEPALTAPRSEGIRKPRMSTKMPDRVLRFREYLGIKPHAA